MVLTDIDTSDARGRSRGSELSGAVSLPAGPGPVRDVLERLGLVLGGELFDRALTHRSFAYERGGLPTNERLEFLGDSILGLVVTEHLFVTYPDLSEGQLAKLRAAVVNSRALADVARGLDLGSLIHLGRGEESTGGRDKSSILADTMEAVIGAVFLEHGVEGARVFVHDLFDDLMADAATRGAGLDWKTSLQELASLGGHGVPLYEVTESGPDHAKTFVATVVLADQTYGPGPVATRRRRSRRRPRSPSPPSALRRSPCRCPTSSTPDRRHAPPPANTASPNTTCTVPELPEVESVRRGLADGLTGRTIAGVTVLHPRPVRRHLPGADDFAAQLVGRTFAEPRRRGKYLWLPFVDGDAVLAHLGMSGQFRFSAADAPQVANTRVLVDFTDGGLQLRFVDQRMFGGLVPVPRRGRAAAGDRPHRARPLRSRVRPR